MSELYYKVVEEKCPSCNGELLDYQRTDDPFLYCLNANCDTFKVEKK
jgi:hypothetical protein